MLYICFFKDKNFLLTETKQSNLQYIETTVTLANLKNLKEGI